MVSRLPRLIVRSVVGRNDRSHDATIDRAIDRCTPRLIIRSAVGCHECSYDQSHAGWHNCSYDRSQEATIDRAISRRPSRLIVRSVATIDRTIGRRALPLVARFPMMVNLIDILQSFVIARPRVEIDRSMRPLLDIVANIADRSHLVPIATNRTIQKSYDPV